MACVSKRQSGAITEYPCTCTHSVNLPGSTKRFQYQHILQSECTFTCRCGKAQSMSPLAVHIMFGGLCRPGKESLAAVRMPPCSPHSFTHMAGGCESMSHNTFPPPPQCLQHASAALMQDPKYSAAKYIT